jgi:hypothetical protein
MERTQISVNYLLRLKRISFVAAHLVRRWSPPYLLYSGLTGGSFLAGMRVAEVQGRVIDHSCPPNTEFKNDDAVKSLHTSSWLCASLIKHINHFTS